MTTNKYSGGVQPDVAPIRTSVPEPTFRSAILLGVIALAVVTAILVYGLINGH